MPQPSGVMNMGYPSSVDSGNVIAWVMQPDDRSGAVASTTSVLTANSTYISTVTWRDFGILTGFRYRCGVGGNGNCDMGLYDASGNLKVHTGLTLTASSSNGTTITLATPFSLSPQKYYIAFWIDNATDTIRNAGVTNGIAMASNTSTGAGGLPATISPPLGGLGVQVAVDGLISGGWS